ncbi:MAG: TVP38/TMEM64 family protein [Candidatus Coproplasma sp.]
MKKTQKIILLCINLLLCALIAVCTSFFMQGWSLTVKIVCYCVAGIGLVFETVTFFIGKDALFKSGFILVILVAITVVFVAIATKVFSLGDYPTDEEKTQRLIEIIKSFGVWGYLVYFLIQVLQVVVLPLPAAVCYIPGSLIWGPLTATLIASAGVITGSVIAYFIGKFCGKPVVIWIAGRETTEKYTNILSKRGKILFLMMQILPFFPDDIICIVAGLTGMNFIFFTAVIVLVRPAIIATYCYLGSGTIIPFSGWGIPVWIAIFAVCIVFAVLSFKYQDKIETWLVKKFKRKKVEKEITEECVPEGDADRTEDG